MKTLFHLSLVLLVLGVFYGVGFISAKKELFPHDQIAKLMRGPEIIPDNPTPRGVGELDGWFELARQPTSAEVTDGLDSLADIGYGDTYENATGNDTGVVIFDETLASPGTNLVVSAHQAGAYLMDMHGEVLHAWEVPYAQLPKSTDYVPKGSFGKKYWRRVHLLEDGGLIAIFDRTALIKIDRDSKLQWVLHGDFHHDLEVTADGTIWALTREDSIHPRFSATKLTVEDFITRVSPDGRILGQTSLLEALEVSEYEPLLMKAAPGGDIFHTNSLTVFDGELAHLKDYYGPGHALVSLWGIDTIAVVNLTQERVVWATTGKWHRQHEPVLLENGNFLLFDNMGVLAEGGPRGGTRMSKLLEFDPETGETIWSYEGNPANDFYSALIGSVQRLPNGNTLATESLAGRAFEVTPTGDVVWRWVSPHRVGDNDEGVAVLMEVVRFAPDAAVLKWL